MTDFKVEIGQEWKHTTWLPTFSSIISKINMPEIEFSFGPSWPPMFVNTFGILFYQSSWVYLGTPIRCDDCGLFCKQKCRI